MENYIVETENNETENNSKKTSPQPTNSETPEPVTTTEEGGEIIKPGKSKERNPKKIR